MFQASTQPLAHDLLLRRLVVTMFSVLEACRLMVKVKVKVHTLDNSASS